MRTRNGFGATVVGVAALLMVGCASSSSTAEKAASTALTQVMIYERDVSAKILAEDTYYDRVMDGAVKRIDRLREDEQPFMIEVESRKFAAKNKGTGASALGPKLVTLLESSMKSWQKRDEGYLRLLAETKATLTKNRHALELEKEKIASLKARLRTLREARSTKDMLSLMVAFTREVKGQLDEMREDTKAPEKAEDS